ncbi:MAG: CehA/McbA family metallohydrolase [Methanomassiliicoccales archaeon]
MRADLHIHTHHSGDNEQRLEEIFEAAARKGLGAIAIVDHNTIKGGLEALDSAPRDLIIIPAVEVTTAQGHVIAYGVEEDIDRGLEVAETIELIHEKGGIAVAAHPYRMWSGLGSKVVLRNKFDALEVINARNTSHGNKKAYKLAQRAHLPMTAGSDAHRPRNIGDAVTIFPDDCLTREEMIQAILEGRTSVEGRGRSKKETLRYGSVSISKWIGRGMRRL